MEKDKEKNAKQNEESELERVAKSVAEIVAPAITPGIVKQVIAEMPLRDKSLFESGSKSERKELEEKQTQAAEYLKALYQNDTVRKKDLSAGVTGNGTELVPTYVSEQAILQAQNYGLVRKYASKWPMKGIDVNVPTFSTVTATRSSSDISALGSSSPATGIVGLRAKTVSVIVPISRVLLNEATPAVVDVINLLIGKAIAKLEDQWALLGLASGEGILQNASAPVFTMSSGNTLYSDMTAENLLDVEDLLDENFVALDSLRWVMSRSSLNVLRRLRSVVGSDKQGFLLQPLGGNLPPTIWDNPFDTTAVMPKTSAGSQAGTKFLALVDWSNVIHGDRMEYSMELSNEATITSSDGSTPINLWQQNMTAIKVWGEIDIQLANADKAFGVLKTAAS